MGQKHSASNTVIPSFVRFASSIAIESVFKHLFGILAHPNSFLLENECINFIKILYRVPALSCIEPSFPEHQQRE